MINSLQSNIKKAFEQIKGFINNLSFQTKLILSIVLGISIFITLCTFLIIRNIQSNIDNEIIKLNHNLSIVQNISHLSAQTVSNKNTNNYEQSLKPTIDLYLKKKNNNICFIIITDNAGKILAKSPLANLYKLTTGSGKKIPPPHNVPYIKTTYSNCGKILTIAEPMQINSSLYGWVWVGFPDEGFTVVGSNKELVFFLLEIFLLVWLLSVIGAIVNSLIITRPLIKLERSAKAISEGRFGFQLPLKGFLGKELSQLVKAFNKMSKRLEQYEESNIALLSSERNKFESVVMSITDGVIVLDKEGTIQIINYAANKILNMSKDELLGQKSTSIWDAKINVIVNDFLHNIKTNSTDIEQVEFDFIKNSRKLKVYITPLDTQYEEKLGALIIIHDRTKEAEIELMKQEFISNVSHELRTPITSIKCYVDTLCSHEHQIDERTKNEFLTIVNEETDRLSKLVNDVLELSRLESPAMKLQLTLQEIYPSIEYAIKATIVLAEKKSIKLKLDIEKDLPLLNINQENLERILVNLISNAIKYTPGNGIVKLVVKKKNNEVLFQVMDNGIGIPEEHLNLIFERFYRVENKVHTVKGTGLGLTIVKKSVEQHNGILNVRSIYGEGSIFEFTIPIPNNDLDIKDLTKIKSKDIPKIA